MINTVQFIKRKGKDISLVQIYDEILFSMLLTNLFVRNLQNACKANSKWAW